MPVLGHGAICEEQRFRWWGQQRNFKNKMEDVFFQKRKAKDTWRTGRESAVSGNHV